MNLKLLHYFLIFQLIGLQVQLFAKEISVEDLAVDTEKFEHSTWDDLTTTFSYMGHASYLQFSGTQNLILWGITAAATAYYIKNDERLSKQVVNERRTTGIHSFVSDMGVIFNTPIVPMMFYTASRINEDEKMLRFSQEYMATTTLSLVESSFISMIPLHERPSTEDTNFWEEKFRHKSSFPSGHLIGYTALAVKTFQFYGPVASIVPFGLAFMTGYERVVTEKHYLSDVIASGFLTVLISEGVRMASGYQNNHPLYKWMFQYKFNIQFIREQDVPGLLLSLSY